MMLIENRKSGSKPENGFYFFGNRFSIFFWSFSSRKLHKNNQMSDKINSHICLMLNVYKSFHRTVKYGHQRNHILQDLTRLEIYISMKDSKIENRFETTENSFAIKTGINIPTEDGLKA